MCLGRSYDLPHVGGDLMNALRTLIKDLANLGMTFAVGDNEGNILKRTKSVNAVCSEIDNLEECYIRIWQGDKKGEGHLGYIYLCDNEIFDHTVGLEPFLIDYYNLVG